MCQAFRLSALAGLRFSRLQASCRHPYSFARQHGRVRASPTESRLMLNARLMRLDDQANEHTLSLIHI